MAMTEEERAIHAWPSETPEQRQAQVNALIVLAEDPAHEYDAHHGTDRSASSLDMLSRTDPDEHERILRKIRENR